MSALIPRPAILDFHDASTTENTRSAYPLSAIANASRTGRAPIPKTIVMLTADAFGVLPPIARLTPQQAMYHFLSGYTAKVAGTERGVTEPQATFSTCFGAPFIPRHPERVWQPAPRPHREASGHRASLSIRVGQEGPTVSVIVWRYATTTNFIECGP